MARELAMIMDLAMIGGLTKVSDLTVEQEQFNGAYKQFDTCSCAALG